MSYKPNRLLVLEKCEDCPHCSDGRDVEMNWCNLANQALPVIDEIPEWCPLPIDNGGAER